MSFTDALRRVRARLAVSCAAVVAACGPPPPAPAPAPRAGPAAGGGGATAPAPAPAPAAAPAPAPAVAVPAPAPSVPAAVAVPPAPASAASRPAAARAPAQAQAPAARAPLAAAPATSWEQFRIHAAHRLVRANPDRTYMSDAPDPLLAIPVLEIELEADGRVRRISVLRHPRQAKDTVQIAIDSVRRAAPYGDVSRLPRPWKFVETFLFDDERRFKPRSLDDG